MTFTFRPAKREKTSALIALAGPTGSGKTYSALKLAIGLAGPAGKIAMIDTESGRGLAYAEMADFDYGGLDAPYSPARYIEAMEATKGYDVVIIDSMSHEWAGIGGCHDMQEQNLDRMAGNDFRKRANMSVLSWSKPKQEHAKLVAHVLQSRAHLIFCFRAEEKLQIQTVEENGRKKTVYVPPQDLPINQRWKWIAEKTWQYEMTASLLLTDANPGAPIHIKVNEAHAGAFDPNKRISEASGEFMARWASGGEEPAPEKPAPLPTKKVEGWPEDPPAANLEFKIVRPSGTIADCEDLADWKAKMLTVAKTYEGRPKEDREKFLEINAGYLIDYATGGYGDDVAEIERAFGREF